jgi:Flp pilus assembly protein TadG
LVRRGVWFWASIGLCLVVGGLVARSIFLRTQGEVTPIPSDASRTPAPELVSSPTRISATATLNPTPQAASSTDNAVPDIPDSEYTGQIVQLGAAKAAPGAGKITLDIILPNGYKFNDIAPFVMHVNQNGGVVTVAPGGNNLSIVEPAMPVSMPVTFHEGQTTLKIDADVYYCDAINESRCYPARLRLVMPLTVGAGASGQPEIAIDYAITPPARTDDTFGNP